MYNMNVDANSFLKCIHWTYSVFEIDQTENQQIHCKAFW